MQKSHRQRPSWLPRRVWLIIAGILLLSHAPVLAKPGILIVKRGGVYYISSREQPRANQADRHTASLRWLPYNPQARPTFPGSQGSISRTNQSHDLRSGVINAVSRIGSRGNLSVATVQGVPGLSQLRFKPAPEVQVAHTAAPQGNMWTAPRYLGWLWGKTGWWPSPALTAPQSGSPGLDLKQNLPPVQEIQDVVREVCRSFLAYAPTAATPPTGPHFLVNPNQFNYCFPVAPPYSFRDTWGDWRSGGRFHHAVDIVAADGTPVYAITSGVIHTLATWHGAGISLILRGQDGRGYGYMHLQGYAPGVFEGKPVRTGELIAYVGHTGIKRDAAHLHLQVYANDSFNRDNLVNPYGLLVQLSNGRGVSDWYSPTMTRRQIPAAEVVDFGPVTFSGSVPPRYQGAQPQIVDTSNWRPNTY